MLNDMEFALLRASGYSTPEYTRLNDRDVIARASKSTGNGVTRAEALGRNEQDAARKLVALIVRR